MKKIVLCLALIFATIPVYSQGKMITISEDDLQDVISTYVKEAVDRAVKDAIAIVVKEYEIKLVDKDIIITNLKADMALETARADKFEELYTLEVLDNQKNIWKILGGFATGFLIGGGIVFLSVGL